MHNDEILQIGALAARLYEASDDEADVLGAQFEQELDRIRALPDIQAQRVTVLIFGLMSLLRGRPYVLNTDDFAKVQLWRSMAAHIGATVTYDATDMGDHRDHWMVRIDPPGFTH
jgi:hypothetical protein